MQVIFLVLNNISIEMSLSKCEISPNVCNMYSVLMKYTKSDQTTVLYM